MILGETGFVLMGLTVFITGVLVQKSSICVLKGSSVNLPCSAEDPTTSLGWYTVTHDGYMTKVNEIWQGERVSYSRSADNRPNLTIKNVTDSDGKDYCCSESAHYSRRCWDNRVQLRVADLQVKVLPTTEGQTVTLMCSLSCLLNETPEAYIWYQNTEFLYEDWSPWYQQLVSNDSTVRYSCAVKGSEHLRAPEVSVDSVTSTCFSVTYAKGRMCSYTHSSEDQPCSITYPRELEIKKTHRNGYVVLTCHTSCRLNDNIFYTWYQGGQLENQNIVTQSAHVYRFSDVGFTCAVKSHEDLLSAEFCLDETNCWSVNYVSRRICALEGSSLNILSEYVHPHNKGPNYLLWFRMSNGRVESAEKLIDGAGGVKYEDNLRNQHILRMTNVKKNDSAEYRFTIQEKDGGLKIVDVPGVTVIVTDLNVKITPSSAVTSGQSVTLTCSSSCPLTDDKNYIWFLNSQPLTLPENQNKKRLVIDKVTVQNAGNYTCAITSNRDIRSPEKTLTVTNSGLSLDESGQWVVAAAAGLCAALLVLILLTVVFCFRKKKLSNKSPGPGTSSNIDQLNPGPVYQEVSAHPKEQEDLTYSKVYFSKSREPPLYSTIQPQQTQEPENVLYADINIRQNRPMQ